MRPVTLIDQAAELADRLVQFEQRPIGAYTPPRPPPADMPIDLDKWRALPRATRRALLREHRRVMGR
jgi:hypothetical protein